MLHTESSNPEIVEKMTLSSSRDVLRKGDLFSHIRIVFGGFDVRKEYGYGIEQRFESLLHQALPLGSGVQRAEPQLPRTGNGRKTTDAVSRYG